ncbi:MAG: hypothetical protein KF760_28700 [Candidatus Eremiobacteraeota bacterium]|nr:hypothetical protein [Candidatus Eremiobacteraeota bacterium]MCW5865876.1 hypothetical protein [Candidatus Eremiobacteraeota bacterium]
MKISKTPNIPPTNLQGGGSVSADGSVQPIAPCATCSHIICICKKNAQPKMEGEQLKINQGGKPSQAQLPGTENKPGTSGGGQSGGNSGGGGGHQGNITKWHCPKCRKFATTSLAAQTAHRVKELRNSFNQFKAWTSRLPFHIPLVDEVERALLNAERKLSTINPKNLAALQKLSSSLSVFERQFGDLANWTKKIDQAPGKLKGLLGKKGVKMVRSMALPPWTQPFIKAWEAGSTAGEVIGEAGVLFEEAATLAARFKWMAGAFL